MMCRDPCNPALIAWRGGLLAAFNWIVWGLLTLLVSAQFLGIIWNSTESEKHVFYGRSPVNGVDRIPGTNDEPYTDRSLVCMAQGRTYVPVQVSHVLRDAKLAPIVDTSGEMINGYRLCKREGMHLDSAIYEKFIRVCERIDYTLDVIQDNCDQLGFNVTRDVLRIVGDVDSNTTREIPRALPILILPFWDNGVTTHYAIPGWDGQACVFRLEGMYIDVDTAAGVMRAATRSSREKKTAEWLGRPGGVWRNGWYEDPTGQRWLSDMMTTETGNMYGVESRQFDTMAKKELDCSFAHTSRLCRSFPAIETWGDQCKSQVQPLAFTAAYISTGNHYGLFFYDGITKGIIENRYSLGTFISNVSIFTILFRWFVSMAAMANSYRRGVAPWQTTGIGCLSSSRTFNVLPAMLLPRLKMIMAAFWTVGCEFQDSQRALSQARFAIYPAIVELVLMYFSLLNSVAKLTHRRMSDAMFGPSVIALALLHYFRLNLAESGWIPFDSRIPTVVSSDEFSKLILPDMFTPTVAVRLSGNVEGFVYVKVILLALNLIPLLFSENMTQSGKKYTEFAPCQVEEALALRASSVGGLGLSPIYVTESLGPAPVTTFSRTSHLSPGQSLKAVFRNRVAVWTPRPSLNEVSHVSPKENREHLYPDHVCPSCGSTKYPPGAPQRHSLSGYELDRLGYMVFGGKFLIAFDDWYILTSLAPLRIVEKLWNHCISVFDVVRRGDGYYVSQTPRLCRLDHAELRSVPFYDITLCALR